jgi:undecaprenyl-diphosphatase
MLHLIIERDHSLMRKIHHWSPPEWLRTVMVCTTRAGDGWLWYGVGAILLLCGDKSKLQALLAGTSATGLGLAIYSIVKRTTRRTRPCLVEPNLWAHVLPPDRYSFPSGHSIAAFAIAASVGLFYPAFMSPLLLAAALIALSRVMLGMHFVSDVIVGSLLGTILGFVAFALTR